MLLACWEEGQLLKEHVLDTAEDALLAFAAQIASPRTRSVSILTGLVRVLVQV